MPRLRKGRKRIVNIARTNGDPTKRPSRAKSATEDRERETEREVMEVAVTARAKHTRLAEPLAKQPFAGSVLGLMHFDRHFSDNQYEAGKRYAEDAARYYSAVGIPFPAARAFDMFSIRGHDGEVSEDRAKAAREASNKIMAIERVLLCLDGGPLVKRKTFEVCVLDDHSAREWTGFTISYVRRGLAALVDYYGIK
jgi:hypothetical protein